MIYSLIAKSDVVLSDYTEYHGNVENVSQSLLKKIQKDHRATFSYDQSFNFHYTNSEGLTYMCMCEISFPQDTAFVFLEDIKSSFLSSCPKEEQMTSFAFQSKFKEVLKSKMEYYNRHPEVKDSLAKLKQGIIETKDVLIETTDKLYERGDKIQLIVKKADSLRSDSHAFFDSAKRTRKTAMMRKIKIILFSILIFLIVAYFISVIACGGFDWGKCRGTD